MKEKYSVPMGDSHVVIDVNHRVAWGGYQLRMRGNRIRIKQKSIIIKQKADGHSRGEITTFSKSSRLRMLEYLSSCVANYTWMITLTYPGEYPCDGTIVKEHLRRFCMKAVTGGLSAKASSDVDARSIFWFVEFQARGAPHFHLFANFVPSIPLVPRCWFDIVGSDDLRHLHAGTRCEKLVADRAGTIGYAMKYAAKSGQKEVPKNFTQVGRFWGIYGCRVTVSASIFVPLFDDAGDEYVAYAKERKFTGKVRNLMVAWLRKGWLEKVSDTDGPFIYRCTDAFARAVIAGEVCSLVRELDDLGIEYRALDFLREGE